jgi:universal stress protein A
MDKYTHILVALDFSASSATLGTRAVALQRLYGARLSFVHVVEHIPLEAGSELLMGPDFDLEQQLVENARARLADYVKQLGVADAGQHVTLGSTKNEITRLALELQADLIVMGSHGRHGLALLLGSTANAVLHAAPCDVLAIRVKA